LSQRLDDNILVHEGASLLQGVHLRYCSQHQTFPVG
jgi:hypothetical protein